MKETTKKFLNLLFDEGETISVSHNKYGYHSVSQEVIGPSIMLVSPKEDIGVTEISEDDINLIAVNPVNGFRRDENVTTYRSFMVEIDSGSLEEQKKYIDGSGLPYSACIFSGNKSLHFAITLSEPMRTLSMWRFYNQWILNILEKTDQQIKNPTRSIRFPGNKRHNGKKLTQSLVFLGERITQDTLLKWLFKHEDKKPVQKQERIASLFETDFIPGLPPQDVQKIVSEGVNVSRNSTWFYVGCRLAEKRWTFDNAVGYLEQYFQAEGDFSRTEWLGCLQSAFKRINGDSYV